ncbi:MAG TPA: hypothetical protein VFA60_11365 [Terriglobales bacterium]|nr:hypothetical protein [Terriglobales bacterium]
MIEAVARPAIQPRNNDDLNVLTLATELQQLFELRAISRLGRLAFFDEDRSDLVVVPLAPFEADLPLRGQAEVLRLFLSRNPAIGDGLPHFNLPGEWLVRNTR